MSGTFPVYDGPAQIVSTDTADGVCRLSLSCPPQARGAKPGQFVLLRHASGPFLPRPLSIVRAGDLLDIVANLWGPGTRAIAAAPVGDTLNLVGPFGNGFASPADPLTIVGDLAHIGGPLALALARNRPDDRVVLVAGDARQRRVLLGLTVGGRFSCRIVPPSGLIAALDDTPNRLAVSATNDIAATVQAHAYAFAHPHPHPHVQADAHGRAAARERPGEVLLHAMMACGLGACHACVHPMRGAPMALVCNGPVFDLQAPLFPTTATTPARAA